MRILASIGCLAGVALTVAAGELPRAETHRAFQPMVRPNVPEVRGDARTAVDCFIRAALEAKGIAPSPEADRPTLVRRVAFDLTGLPPTPAEIDGFLTDRSPAAYERMVERYLASPRYGERWGKYWLDAAGYADSNGYFAADPERPPAHRYPDFVLPPRHRAPPGASLPRLRRPRLEPRHAARRGAPRPARGRRAVGLAARPAGLA